MRNLLLTLLVFLILPGLKAQTKKSDKVFYDRATTVLDSSYDVLLQEIDCENKKMVSDKAFNKITANFLTTITPGASGQLKNGTSASLKINDDKLSAELQAAFQIGARSLLNVGFNGDVTDNISTVYTGKDGVSPNWGVKAGYSLRLKSSSLFYESKQECYNYNVGRANHLWKKYNELKPYTDLKYANGTLDSLKAVLADLNSKLATASGRAHYDADQIKTYGSQIKELREQYDMLWELYDLKDRDTEYKKNYVFEMLEDSLVNYEVKNANWTGYSIWLLNWNAFYNKREFTQYNTNTPIYSDRFQDRNFSNWGGTFGMSWFRLTDRLAHNLNIDLGTQRQANYQLSENKKYKTEFTTDSTITSVPGNPVSYTATRRTAFDSTRLPYKDYWVFNLAAQYSLLFGKNRNFGLNFTANWAYSKSYDVKNRVDIFAGPMVAIPNQEKDGSVVNFALMAGYKNIADSKLTAKEKFSILFNISVPFKIISLSKN